PGPCRSGRLEGRLDRAPMLGRRRRRIFPNPFLATERGVAFPGQPKPLAVVLVIARPLTRAAGGRLFETLVQAADLGLLLDDAALGGTNLLPGGNARPLEITGERVGAPREVGAAPFEGGNAVELLGLRPLGGAWRGALPIELRLQLGDLRLQGHDAPGTATQVLDLLLEGLTLGERRIESRLTAVPFRRDRGQFAGELPALVAALGE